MSLANPDLQLTASIVDDAGVVQSQTHTDPSTGISMDTNRAPDGVMRQSFTHPRIEGRFDSYDALRELVEVLPDPVPGDKAEAKAKAK
jgi:hypothetical protein